MIIILKIFIIIILKIIIILMYKTQSTYKNQHFISSKSAENNNFDGSRKNNPRNSKLY